MRRALAIAALATLGCSERAQIALDYDLSGLTLADVVRVETYVSVDPSDPRAFFADQPFRAVATGVGYEVRDFDGSGKRKVLITHDASLGFMFTPKFTFTLLPPTGTAPPLLVNARAVGAATMLGRTDPLKTQFAAGRHLEIKIGDMRCAGVACASDEECCNDVCTNVLSTVEHCGACGNQCLPLGDNCAGGTCQCAGGSACMSGRTCCATVGCVDLMTDPFNCGACNQRCNPGETCSGGTCGCNGGAACGASGLCCAVGGCSQTGSCPCGASPCAAPKVCCNAALGTCVDVAGDDSNCGKCGQSCAAPLHCSGGACACNGQICSAGDTCCSTGCANLQTSISDCGSCGHACAPNELCVAGVCKCGSDTCTSGEMCCDDTCVDPMSDEMNCGACGKPCNPGEQCLAGACVCPGTDPPRACSSTETCCSNASQVDGGGCFDLTNSHDHCGSCIKACTDVEECRSSMCVQTQCSPPCVNGNMCDSMQMPPRCECNDSLPCIDKFCCPTGCTNRLNDPANCGMCGNNVSPNLCCNGMSTPHTPQHCTTCGIGCLAGQLCCRNSNGGFGCINQNAMNCGGCGIACPLATQSCCVCPGKPSRCDIACICTGG